jgi:outer membrane lipoprotein carrier protein
MLKSLFISLSFLCASAVAKAPFKSADTFGSTIARYQTAKLISMKVQKTVKSELLGKETIFKGHIQLSSGKFRWENNEPEKSLLLFDGRNLFNVQYPPEDFGGPVQVAKSKVDQKTRKQILISSLLSPSDAKTKFKVLKVQKTGEVVDYQISPEGEELQIKELTVRIQPKNQQIDEISYKDDVGNLTRMAFTDVVFSKKADPEIFKFKMPKGAQVTDI